MSASASCLLPSPCTVGPARFGSARPSVVALGAGGGDCGQKDVQHVGADVTRQRKRQRVRGENVKAVVNLTSKVQRPSPTATMLFLQTEVTSLKTNFGHSFLHTG